MFNDIDDKFVGYAISGYYIDSDKVKRESRLCWISYNNTIVNFLCAVTFPNKQRRTYLPD